MEQKTYNFQNPELQQKATAKAAVAKRPTTYRTRRKKVDEVQKELIREELLKQGFIQQIGAVLPQINEALIASAMQPNSSGASDRKTVYTALKILTKDKDDEPQETIGQLLAELAQS